MPRVKHTFCNIELRDSLALASIINALPLESINEVLKETDCFSKRNRILPHYFVIYLTIFLCIFKNKATDEVLRHLFEGLEAVFPDKKILKASDAAISKARGKLGEEPLKLLFKKFCKPLCTNADEYAYYEGLHKVAIDASEIYLICTSDVLSEFPLANEDGKNPQNCPKIKFGALMEIGSQAYIDVEYGNVNNSEQDYADVIIGRLDKGNLLIGDRYYRSVLNIKRIIEQESEVLCRATSNMTLKPKKNLPDGTYIAEIVASRSSERHSVAFKTEDEDYKKVDVRVIPAILKANDSDDVEHVRLITSLVDHVRYHAQDLIDMYTERWRVETGFDDIKAHMMTGAQDNLRSKTASLVKQEFWAMLIAYYVIRKIIYQASRLSNYIPAKISFTGARDIIQRKTTAKSFPPSAQCTDSQTI